VNGLAKSGSTPPLTITISNSLTNNFHEWFHYMLDNTDNESMQTITTIIYSMWNSRNSKVFKQQNIPVNIMINKALKILHEYQHNAIPAQTLSKSSSYPSSASNNVSWSPPPSSYLALNVDAHRFGDGHWGLGMVLRREDGRVVGAATRVCKGSEDVDFAEAMGFSEAVQWIQKLQIGRVIIGMDAAHIVTAARDSIFPRTQWGMIVRDAVRVMKLCPDVSVEWIGREKNNVAHTLARWAVHEPNKDWADSYPSCIHTLIQKDRDFVTFA
jgi:ribonuclease HI